MTLGIDTSSLGISIAISDNNKILGNLSLNSKKPSGDKLIYLTDNLVKMCSLDISDIKGLILTTGPGSFTGLRISMAFSKALSLSMDIKVKGINTLFAMAWPLRFSDSFILPVIDAKKGEVYSSLYKAQQNSLLEIIKPDSYKAETLLSKLPNKNILVIGDGQNILKNIKSLNFTFIEQNYSFVDAKNLCFLWHNSQAYDLDPLKDVPKYFRLSQAETNK